MFKELLHPVIQQFLSEHENDNEQELILKYREVHGVPISIVINQISGRRKAKNKLPTYFNQNHILYPKGLNLEQSSSERTGLYKIEILKRLLSHTDSCVDLTGGLGVDLFFFSKIFSHAVYVDSNPELGEIAKHNHQVLKSSNIEYHYLPAENFLDNTTQQFDLIYLDPDRRSKSQKGVSLKDCEPDITTCLPLIFKHTKYVLIKTSPLLDISQGIKDLDNVKSVFIVSVSNECKEVLFFCEHGYSEEPSIEAINLSRNNTVQTFTFYHSKEKEITLSFEDPKKYLYEPNASVLKAGAFKSIAVEFNLSKLDVHTHLYTSEELLNDFPGRVFEIEAMVKPEKKSVLIHLPDLTANITTRNYPLSVAELRKKTQVKDGGNKFLFGFTACSKKYLAIANRIY